jgi:hypothetical protein
MKTAPTRRLTAAGPGQMPATLDRRLISLFPSLEPFVLCSLRLMLARRMPAREDLFGGLLEDRQAELQAVCDLPQ